MAFDNSKNQARARNMAELLGHVQKSAQANDATPAQVAEVLAPALDALDALGLQIVPQGGAEIAQEAETPVTGAEPPGDPVRDLKPGQRAALMLADQASMRELVVALIARLDHNFPATPKEGEE